MVEVSAEGTAVHLTVTTTAFATVQCLTVGVTDPVPALSAFVERPAYPVEQIGEVTITGLTEDTAYVAYCLGRDVFGQAMANAVNTTATAFTTPLHHHTLFVELLRLEELDAMLTVLADEAATVWCGAVHANDLPPTANTLKASGVQTSVMLGVPVALTLPNLNADYPYAAYCYSESVETSRPQAGTIAATFTNFTTADYPELSLELSSIASNPSYYNVEMDITVSTPSTVYCRPRAVSENELPPSNQWVMEGSQMTISQASIKHYFTLSSLLPD